MTDKLTLTCIDFRPVCKGGLRGFATIRTAEMRMSITDVAVHVESNGRAWASPPARPMIGRAGQIVRDERGKVAYSQIISFDSKAVRDAWSDAVVRAVLQFDRDALTCREAAE